jgi:hypothetical protein
VALTIARTASVGTPGLDLTEITNVAELSLPCATLISTLRGMCPPGARLPVEKVPLNTWAVTFDPPSK